MCWDLPEFFGEEKLDSPRYLDKINGSIDLCVNNGTHHDLSLAFLKKDRNNDC